MKAIINTLESEIKKKGIYWYEISDKSEKVFLAVDCILADMHQDLIDCVKRNLRNEESKR